MLHPVDDKFLPFLPEGDGVHVGVVDGDLGPGAGGVAPGGAQLAKGLQGQAAGILAQGVVPENDDELVLVNPPTMVQETSPVRRKKSARITRMSGVFTGPRKA